MAEMKSFPRLIASLVFLPLFWSLSSTAWPQSSGEPRLIRDTDIAEGKDSAEAEAPKEPNPLLAERNVNIGNYYLKQKNYAAAIQRFLEAIDYKSDLIKAYEGLAQAYEKNGEIHKAIDAYKGFLEKNPDSPKASEFRTKVAKLEKKSN